MPAHDLTGGRLPPRLRGYAGAGIIAGRRDPIEVMRRGHQQLGPVFSVRLGAKRAAIVAGPGDAGIYGALVPIPGSSVAAAASPEDYAEQRALMQSAFLPARMPECLRVTIERAQTRLDLLGAAGGLDLAAAVEDLVLETVACALMGTDFRHRMRPDLWRLYRDIVDAVDFVLPSNLPLPKFRRRDRAQRILDERIAELIDARRAMPGVHRDLIQELAEARSSSGARLPMSQLQATIHMLLLSASERTPRHASWTLRHLLQHPECLASVVAEQDAVVGRSAPAITIETVGRLRRLQTAIEETARMQPALTILWRHTAQEYEVDGYRVPRGWITLIGPQRSTALRPEDSLAHLLMKAILTLLLQRYELDPRAGTCIVRYRRR